MRRILALLMLLCAAGAASAFTVDPSRVRVVDVKQGVKVEAQAVAGKGGYFITVNNTGRAEAKFRLQVMSCKEYGCDPYIGYEEIPDINWITVSEPVIVIPGGEHGYFKGIFVKVPKKKKYQGKKFQAIVRVSEEPVAGRSMNVEVVIPLWIEVANKK